MTSKSAAEQPGENVPVKKYATYKKVGLFLGIILFFLILYMPQPVGMNDEGQKVLALVALMVTWWVMEAIPIGVTALLPMMICPIIGLAGNRVTESGINVFSGYSNPAPMMCMGIFIFAACIVKWNLHKRIALSIVKLVGNKPSRILLGFTLATTFISMWISNMTAVALMLPIGIALLLELGLDKDNGFSKALILTLPFSASIGGLCTMIGSGANISAVSLMRELSGQDITFMDWFIVGLPFTVVLVPLMWYALAKMFKVDSNKLSDVSVINRELASMGRMSKGEKLCATLFTITILCFMFRSQVINPFFPMVSDESIAITLGIIIFVIPVDLKRGIFLMDMKTTLRGVAWDTVLLLGGAYTMGHLITRTGLTKWIAGHLEFLNGMNEIMVIITVCIIIAVVTEFATNLVVAVSFLPMIYGIAAAIGMNPMLLMFSVALPASFAYMLPTGTPTNAVAFGSGYIEIKDMIKAGFVVKLISIVIFPLVMYLLSAPLTDMF